MTEINTKNASTLAFEEIYRHAYKIVLMMRAPDLYEQVKQLEQDWLKTNVRTLIVDSISSSLVRAQKSTDAQDQSSERREAGEKFLTVLKDAWEDHQLGMGMVTDVLMYMVSLLRSKVLLYCYNALTVYSGPYGSKPYPPTHLRCLHGSIP